MGVEKCGIDLWIFERELYVLPDMLSVHDNDNTYGPAGLCNYRYMFEYIYIYIHRKNSFPATNFHKYKKFDCCLQSPVIKLIENKVRV